jgi:hypothetical protein
MLKMKLQPIGYVDTFNNACLAVYLQENDMALRCYPMYAAKHFSHAAKG